MKTKINKSYLWGLWIFLVVSLVSCSNESEKQELDKQLLIKMDALQDGGVINITESTYTYLFDRFEEGKGYIDIGNKIYIVNKESIDTYVLISPNTNKEGYYFEVVIKNIETTPGKVSPKTMVIKKKCGKYYNRKIVGDFELSLKDYKNPEATIFIKNTYGEKFVYAEMQMGQYTNNIEVDQLKFSPTDTLTIKISIGKKLVFYKYNKRGNETRLQQCGFIPYVAILFKLD